MIEVVGDFETASACVLKLAGSSAYAQHPTTEVLCFNFEYNGGVDRWTPENDRPNHPLRDLADDPEVRFVAHNAGFEKDIWRYIMVPVYGFPDIPNSRWDDTMAIAAYKQVPLDVEFLSRVLGLPGEKDMEGRRITLSLSKPNKKTGMYPVRTPELMSRVYSYCDGDVVQERGALNRLGRLSPGERKVWLLDQRINERGVKLDLDFISACREVVEKASKPLAAEFTEITGLKFSQAAKVKEWVIGQGVNIPNLTKETIAELLGSDEDDDEEENFDEGGMDIELPPMVARALTIRKLVGSASVKKLARMEACVGADGRVRRLLQYHRAGPGRWAGRLLQPQNFPRGSIKIDGKKVGVETIVAALMTRDPDYIQMVIGAPVETVVGALRHALVADKGRVYISGDFSQIEARIVLALAGQYDKVQVFVTGKPYIDMAEDIYERSIDKDNDVAEYTIGKSTVLGAGFGLGHKSFQKKYAKDHPLEFSKRVIDTYRNDWAPMVPKLWYGLEAAAIKAVWDKQPTEAYGVLYQLEDGWLSARLPSGRKIWYWNPQPVKRVMPWDDTDVRRAWTYQAIKNNKWRTIDAFGGLLTENVVQGLARDLLVTAMFKLEANNFPLVLTVHDEALAEPEEKYLDELAFSQIMCDSPEWAQALKIPVAVETWSGARYKK